MRLPRFTIGGLMAFTVLAAVGFAALRGASNAWAYAMLGLASAAFVGTAVRAVFCRGRKRAFWAAFAAVGALFLALTCAPWLDEHAGAALPTTTLIDALFPRLSRDASSGLVVVTYFLSANNSGTGVALQNTQGSAAAPLSISVQFAITPPPGSKGPPRFRVVSLVPPNLQPFRRIANSLLSLLFAWLAGLLALAAIALYTRLRPRPRPPAPAEAA